MVIKKDINRIRKPAIKFIRDTGKDLVEEWSKLRNHSFGELVNPNVKRYEEKPIFETADWTSALKWQTKGHTIIRAYSNKDVYCTSEIKKDLDRPECRTILQNIEDFNHNNFDDMLALINSIHIINLRRDCWELSECT